MTSKTGKSRPAYHQSYELIREMILRGDLPRGTKVVEDKLATELGVSRTPIRESIRKLEQEGLISDKMVINPSEKDLRNSFQVRILLEGYAARCAATYLSEDKLDLLEQCVHIGRTGTIDEIMQANEEFHEIIVKASNNAAMIDIIDRMQSIIYLFRRTVVHYNRPFLIDEHEQICNAIKSRDPQSAELLMKNHLQADLEFCLHLFNNDDKK